MIPILYEVGEEAFDSNGIGHLADCLSCIVTEQRNGIYDLEMTYPVNGLNYDEISERRIIYAPHDSSEEYQPFDIVQISKPLKGAVTIRANHVSYRLNSTIVRPFSNATSVSDVFSKIPDRLARYQNSPFTYTNYKDVEGNFTLKTPRSVKSLLFGEEGSILDVYGTGEYEFDHFNVILRVKRGDTDTGAVIRYGDAMRDLKYESDVSEVWDGVVPFWFDESNRVVVCGNTVGVSSEVDTIPRRVITLDCSEKFETQPTGAQLTAAAETYINNNRPGGIPLKIEVDMMDTSENTRFQNLKLCDYVTIAHENMGIWIDSEIIETQYDVLRERYKKLTIGTIQKSLRDAIRKTVGVK